MREDIARDLTNGTSSYADGDYKRACELFRRVIDDQPKFAFAHLYLALSLWKLGDIHSSLIEFQVLLSLDAEIGDTYFFFGAMLEEIGEEEMAHQVYVQGINIKNPFPKTYASLGTLLHSRADRSKDNDTMEFALGCYLKYVKLDEEQALYVSDRTGEEIWMRIAGFHVERRHSEQALLAIKNGLKCYPRSHRLYNYLAQGLEHTGDTVGAKEAYDQAKRLEAGNRNDASPKQTPLVDHTRNASSAPNLISKTSPMQYIKLTKLEDSPRTELDGVFYTWALDQCLTKIGTLSRDGEGFWNWLYNLKKDVTVGYAHSSTSNPLSIYYMLHHNWQIVDTVIWVSTQCLVVFSVGSRLPSDDPSRKAFGLPDDLVGTTGTVLAPWAKWFMKRLVYSDILKPGEPISAELALDVMRDIHEYYGNFAEDAL